MAETQRTCGYPDRIDDAIGHHGAPREMALERELTRADHLLGHVGMTLDILDVVPQAWLLQHLIEQPEDLGDLDHGLVQSLFLAEQWQHRRDREIEIAHDGVDRSIECVQNALSFGQHGRDVELLRFPHLRGRQKLVKFYILNSAQPSEAVGAPSVQQSDEDVLIICLFSSFDVGSRQRPKVWSGLSGLGQRGVFRVHRDIRDLAACSIGAMLHHQRIVGVHQPVSRRLSLPRPRKLSCTLQGLPMGE